jgi:thiamine kinase-like enzyme
VLAASPGWPHGPLEVVEATRIGVGYGLSGQSYRITATTETGGTRSFVVKRESAENIERELLFRSHCEELAGGCIPRCLGGVYDADSGRGVLVLEDIAPAEQGDVLRGCSDEQAEAVVRAQARIHGATWRPSADGFAEELPRWAPRPREADAWIDLLARASERYPTILTPDRRAQLHDLPTRVATSVERLRAGPASWIQVDAHLDNVLWRPDGTAVLLDWSTAAIGPPAVDLVRSLVEGMAAPSTAGPLLEAYADELRRQGVTAGDAAELRVAMRIALPALVQGAVGWAGREGPILHARMADVCESFLRNVCTWSDAENVVP